MRWLCKFCGHEIISDFEPEELKWKDGHTCEFKEAFAYNIVRDEMPQGVTERSLEFIDKWKELLDDVDAISIIMTGDVEWETRVMAGDLILITDGFSVGYSGEGPSGLAKLIERFNLKGVHPREVRLELNQVYVWLKA